MENRSDKLHGNVVFNFRRNPVRDLTAFAEGYLRAGRALANDLAQRGYADYEGYPILFLYRHALELSLKTIVFRGALLLRLENKATIDIRKIFEVHGLARWLPPIRVIVAGVGWGSDKTTVSDIEDLVHLVEEMDPLSYNFRYPVDRKGTSPLPHHFVVNVLELAERFDEVVTMLIAAAECLEDYYDLLLEAEQELREAMDTAE